MNKLLTISILLLSLNLYGADKPIYSRTGLEGWGKEGGVYIWVEDYSDGYKSFDLKAIKNLVELKLRLAGIKITQAPPSHTIYINMHPIQLRERLIGYHLKIEPQRILTFKYNKKEYTSYGSCNMGYGGVSPINYRPFLEKQMDGFLLDYLKANPKKKEKE